MLGRTINIKIWVRITVISRCTISTSIGSGGRKMQWKINNTMITSTEWIIDAFKIMADWSLHNIMSRMLLTPVWLILVGSSTNWCKPRLRKQSRKQLLTPSLRAECECQSIKGRLKSPKITVVAVGCMILYNNSIRDLVALGSLKWSRQEFGGLYTRIIRFIHMAWHKNCVKKMMVTWLEEKASKSDFKNVHSFRGRETILLHSH